MGTGSKHEIRLYDVSTPPGGFWEIHVGPPRVILAAKNASKVNFGNNAGFLVFYKSGFNFSRPKPACAMAGAGQQTAVGDSTGGPEAN